MSLLNSNRDAELDVKIGRIIIFVLAGLMVLSAFAEYYLIVESIWVFVIYAPVVIAYVCFGIFYYRNPFAFAVAALVIYLVIIGLSLYANPQNITKGIYLKIAIIFSLGKAIQYGRDFAVKKKRQAQPNTLDDNLIP